MPTGQPAHAYDEVASFFANGPSRQEISTFRLSDAAVARLASVSRSDCSIAERVVTKMTASIAITRVSNDAVVIRAKRRATLLTTW